MIYKRLYDIQSIIIKLIVAVMIIVVMVSAGKNFSENPIFIGVFLVIGLLSLIIIAKTDILILSSKGLIFRTNYWIIRNKDEIIKYDCIKEITYIEDYTIEKEITRNMLPGYQSLEPNKLYIKMKDDSFKEFKFYVFKEQLRDFVAKGKELIK